MFVRSDAETARSVVRKTVTEFRCSMQSFCKMSVVSCVVPLYPYSTVPNLCKVPDLVTPTWSLVSTPVWCSSFSSVLNLTGSKPIRKHTTKRYHSTVLPSVSHNGSQDCLSPCRNWDWHVPTSSRSEWTPCHIEFILSCQNIRRLISNSTTVHSPILYLSEPEKYALLNIHIPFHG